MATGSVPDAKARIGRVWALPRAVHVRGMSAKLEAGPEMPGKRLVIDGCEECGTALWHRGLWAASPQPLRLLCPQGTREGGAEPEARQEAQGPAPEAHGAVLLQSALQAQGGCFLERPLGSPLDLCQPEALGSGMLQSNFLLQWVRHWLPERSPALWPRGLCRKQEAPVQ